MPWIPQAEPARLAEARRWLIVAIVVAVAYAPAAVAIAMLVTGEA
ncbi:MAG: hypothetical protein WD557_10725 [Dehalococcoidia bacterium]